MMWIIANNSGTGLVPASAMLFIPVLDWPDADIPAFKKHPGEMGYIHSLHVHTAINGLSAR